jgi:hypothetical protein
MRARRCCLPERQLRRAFLFAPLFFFFLRRHADAYFLPPLFAVI